MDVQLDGGMGGGESDEFMNARAYIDYMGQCRFSYFSVLSANSS